ncbi:MAG: fibrillarin-like rRNA/tRNA 2'-O-methyltransferase [Candidatus Thorarchaeota archaeon]
MSVKRTAFPGVFTIGDGDRRSLATRSIVKGQSVYGEKVVTIGDEDYRLWMPRRSKLAAAIRNGLKNMPIQPGSRVLYLGAASGTTVSHVSDIVGMERVVTAVEFSPVSARSLVRLADSRPNILPIVEDARHPMRYSTLVAGPIDVVYQDIAQPDQARILCDNLLVYCSIGTWAMIAIKARSIDSVAPVSTVFEREIETLEREGLEVVERVELEPHEKDHIMVVARVARDI